LEESPFGPWVDSTSSAEQQGPLAGSGLEHIASVYSALAEHRNIGPREADDLYLWEIAVLLGLHKTPEQSAPAGPHDHLRRRLEAAAAGEPEPGWGDPSPEEVAQMMALMGELS
jgi:hypothetical protein